MDLLPEHTTHPDADHWEEWRHQQAEVEQRLVTLWQQKLALQFQLEEVRQLRQSLLWHRQERERIRQQLVFPRLKR
jgi:TfoX/Sxy family transcriptional regulator of competence genes